MLGQSFDYEDEEEEETEIDLDPTKCNESHNLKSVNDAIRASLKLLIIVPSNEGQKSSPIKGLRLSSKNKRIAHLNGLARLWSIKEDLERSEIENFSEVKGASEASSSDKFEIVADNTPPIFDHSLHLREVLLCLRVPLINESSEIRASTLRTIRLLVNEPEHVDIITEIHIHQLIARSLDIDLDNKVERIQALKLIRRCSHLSSKDIPLSLARATIALVEGGPIEGDRLYRASLCMCSELSILHTEVFIKANGVPALTHALLDCSVSRMAESILGCLTALHNDPKTRSHAKVQLGIVVAPFTEFRYVHNANAPSIIVGAGPGPGASHEIRDPGEERDFRFECAETAILSMMRSWPGLLQMTEPGAKNGVSHLQALIDILYLENSYVRKKILLLMYDVLNIKAPNDLSNFSLALESTDPSSFRESWKLAEDFVAKEGFDILPRLAKSRPNLLESHIGYVLGSLLKTELPDALIKVIVNANSDDLSILATILLGELLHLAFILLPRELNATSHCLPALLAEVSSSDAIRSNRAAEAVDALHRLHDIKKRGPIGNSLFLVQIMAGSPRSAGRESCIGDRFGLPANWSELLKHEPAANDRINASIRDSQVNNVTVDPDTAWDWDLITSVFRWPSDNFRSQESPESRHFVKRIVDFFKPSGNKFSAVELKLSNGSHNKKSKFLAKTGCYVIDFLVSYQSLELSKILDDFLSDIQNNFKVLISSPSTHDCFLSPTRVATTACQYYFLFIGRLSRSETGRQFLDKHFILQSLLMMLSLRSDLYLKLVISSLDYSTMDWGSRNLLTKALTKEGSESCRLYATRFLGVLIRSRTSNVAQWGINLLVCQLFDPSKTIAWVALEILEDACDDKMNLEAVVCAIKSRPLSDLNHLGLKGVLLYTRFLSSNNGFEFLKEKDEGAFLKEEVKRWNQELNLKYVSLIEELLNDGLSKHQLNETRSYGRRSRESFSVKDVFVPPHLYGQLVLTQAGLEILMNEKAVINMIKFLVNLCNKKSPSSGVLHDLRGIISVHENDWTSIKTAIWATAHMSSSSIGAKWVDRQGGVAALINIAERCDVYSLRGTAFYSLGLIATNKYGCQLLSSYGWCSLRYGRNEQLPVTDDWFQSTPQPFRKPIDPETVEKSVDEESDIVCSSLGTSLSDPEPPARFSFTGSLMEPHLCSSKNTANSTKRDQLQLTPEKEEFPRVHSITSSGKKALNSIMRSFSLGKEDIKRNNDSTKSREERIKQSHGRRSFTLPKPIQKIRRPLFSDTRSSKDESLNPTSSLLPNDEQGIQRDELADKCIRPENVGKNKQLQVCHARAPVATPEDTSDSCSDKGALPPLGNIKEESLDILKAGQYQEKSATLAHTTEAEKLLSGPSPIEEILSNKILVRVDVSNSERLSNENVDVHVVEEHRTESSTLSSSEFNFQRATAERKTLSPIASSTSVSAMEVSSEEKQLVNPVDCHIAHQDVKTPNESLTSGEKDKNIDIGEAKENEKSELSNIPSHSKTFIATTRSNPRPLLPVNFRRAGKRAFSESEAQNFSHITRNTSNVPSSLYYWTSDRSTRSEHSYSETPRNTASIGIPKISLISGSQHGTTYQMETPVLGLCTSVTSISSNGSWTENPGFLTVQDLKKRKRPQLVDNETLTNIDGLANAVPTGVAGIGLGQEYNRHSQRNPTGIFTSSEGRGSNSTFSNFGTIGVPRRNSIAQKFQSLDYRFNRPKYMHSRGQGKKLR